MTRIRSHCSRLARHMVCGGPQTDMHWHKLRIQKYDSSMEGFTVAYNSMHIIIAPNTLAQTPNTEDGYALAQTPNTEVGMALVWVSG